VREFPINGGGNHLCTHVFDGHSFIATGLKPISVGECSSFVSDSAAQTNISYQETSHAMTDNPYRITEVLPTRLPLLPPMELSDLDLVCASPNNSD